MKSADENRPMMGLRRGFEVVEFLARRPDGSGFSEIREALDGLAPTTVSRVLKVLQESGYVDKQAETGKYILSERSRQLGRAITGQLSREEILHPILTRLAEETNETAAYFENGGEGTMLRAKVERENSVHMRDVLSSTWRMAHNEFGQVCLAWRARSDWRKFYEMEPPDGLTFNQFAKRLETIRKENYFCHAGGSRAGWKRLVAPVFEGEDGDFAGSIGVTLANGKRTKKELEALRLCVTRTATEATRALQGHT